VSGTAPAALRAARHVVVFTGAGVSAESGIPTFRDALTGLWSRFDPAQLATAGAFERDPALVWGWYEWRRALVARAEPNAAHRAIAAMGSRVPKLTLVTQNVDDLHERAGSRPPSPARQPLRAALLRLRAPRRIAAAAARRGGASRAAALRLRRPHPSRASCGSARRCRRT
jgi:NAD-dependent SIR2 family protein deacetylase